MKPIGPYEWMAFLAVLFLFALVLMSAYRMLMSAMKDGADYYAKAAEFKADALAQVEQGKKVLLKISARPRKTRRVIPSGPFPRKVMRRRRGIG